MNRLIKVQPQDVVTLQPNSLTSPQDARKVGNVLYRSFYNNGKLDPGKLSSLLTAIHGHRLSGEEQAELTRILGSNGQQLSDYCGRVLARQG